MKILAFYLLLLLALPILADEYAVISNQGIKSLTPMQIRAIFLKKLTHLEGLHLVPINLPRTHPLRKKFEKEILHMGFERLKSYWSKEHYHGNRPPITQHSQESALVFVTKVQGTLSYVNVKNINANVTILYQWRDE